jgi:hypothetical protein
MKMGPAMPDIRKKPLIAERVLLIGDGVIPQPVLEELPDRSLQIFMREPDPALWPTQMEHMVEYLSAQERLGYAVAKVLAGHDSLVRPALDAWASSAWDDLATGESLTGERSEMIIQAMLKHLELLLRQFLARSSTRPE